MRAQHQSVCIFSEDHRHGTVMDAELGWKHEVQSFGFSLMHKLDNSYAQGNKLAFR